MVNPVTAQIEMQNVAPSPTSDQPIELVEFFTELARLLVDAGISHAQFTRISEVAFFRAAANGARFRNAKINQSAIAAMTGLNRTRVRGLLKKGFRGFSAAENRIDRIVTAWVSEPEFLTSAGEPRRLRLSGGKGTFDWLAKKHGGDVPTKAILAELSRRRAIRIRAGYVVLSATARKTRESKRLNQIARALTSVLRLPGEGRNSQSVRVANFEVTHPSTTAVGRVILQRRIAKSLRAFISDIEAAGAAVALEAPAQVGKEQRYGKTGVFLISQD